METNVKRILFAPFLLGFVVIAFPIYAEQDVQAKRKGAVGRRVAAPYLDLRMAALTPDGRYLSYVEWETANLALYDLTTGDSRNLTGEGSWSELPQFAYWSAISPDGQHVAYAWFHAFGGQDSSCELRIIGVDGSRERVIYHNEEVQNIEPRAWHPDGKRILAILRRKDETSQIVLVSVADGSVQVLKTAYERPHTYRVEMSFSPDGRYIVYSTPQQGSRLHDIFLLSAVSGRETPLVVHPANDLALGWTPDGKAILVTSDRTGTLGVWFIRVTDGKPQGAPELIKADIGPNFMPLGFDRKGSYYYGILSAKTDLHVATVDPATGKLLAPPTLIRQLLGFDTSPEWSPDGKRLAYVSQRGPGVWGELYPTSLWVRSLETGQEREIPLKMRKHFELQPRWSPDGRAFLLDGEGEGHGGHRISLDTGEITIIWTAEGGDDRGWSSWSGDGKAVFYRRGRKILLRDLQTGQERELYRVDRPSRLVHFSVSPNGQQIAFVESDEEPQSEQEKGTTALKIMTIVSGESRELLKVRGPKVISRVDWMPDGRYVLFDRGRSSGQEQRFELWRISVESGEAQPLGLAMEGVRLYGLRAHPDGRRLAFTTGRSNVYDAFEVWVLENFLPAAKAAK